MFLYFSSKQNLTEVLYSMKRDRPRIILTDYNCILNNRFMIRDDNEEDAVNTVTELISNCKTLEFKIFDNKNTTSEIIDGLKIVNLYEPIILQEELGVEFRERYANVLKTEENIWTVSLDDYKKNNLLGKYISELVFKDVDIYILFSSLTDAFNYKLFQPVSNDTTIIVFDIFSNYPNTFKSEFVEFLKSEKKPDE